MEENMLALKVKGMTCNHCVKSVKEALESVEGSQDVSVDLGSGIAKVDGKVDVNQLIAAVEEEGYSASAIA
jgi:copper chaperone